MGRSLLLRGYSVRYLFYHAILFIVGTYITHILRFFARHTPVSISSRFCFLLPHAFILHLETIVQ